MGRSLLPPAVATYVGSVISQESGLESRLRAETARLPQAGMQSDPDAGALIALLVRLCNAQQAIEVGTFTGYTALKIAAALPAGGRLVCCDVNEPWTRIGQRYWAEAGLSARIDLRLGPAGETLAALLRDAGAGSFDFAFIDADKPGYDGYYEACLGLLRPGGLIVLDNMLWGGSVADERASDPDTLALRTLNQKIRDDPRVDCALLTVGDGLMLACKR